MSEDKKNGTVDQLGLLASVLQEAILFLDDKGQVVRCTPGQIHWLDHEKIENKSLRDLFPESVIPDIEELLEKAKDLPQYAELLLRPETVPVFRDAGLVEPQWVKVSMTGTEHGFVVTVRDETEQKRLGRKVVGHSQRDIITGAYNRRTLMPVISQAIAQAQRYDWICSLVIVSIDGLSNIREHLGWDVGDHVLHTFVKELGKLKRTADFMARVSDNKFALFLPETNREQALLASARIIRLAESLEIEAEGETISVSVSIGASTLNSIDDNAETLLSRSEENLAVAVRRGGNTAEGDTL
ncbi:MAG: diguanylate cyclase [Pontibacterium sp.]